jgi:hypothetical protein
VPSELPPLPAVGGSYRLNKKGDGYDLVTPTTQPWCAHHAQESADEPEPPAPAPAPAPPTDN